MSLKNGMCITINPEMLIAEVRKRPGLYDNSTKPMDRIDRLDLWKEVGDAMFPDWSTLKKSAAYDRIIQMQRKWRSLRDAYMREIRWRKAGAKKGKRIYIYFKKMMFLGGMDGLSPEALKLSENDDEDCHSNNSSHYEEERLDMDLLEDSPPQRPKKQKQKKQKPKMRKPRPKIEEFSDEDDDNQIQTEEIEIPAYIDTEDSDSDRLFLMSFLPEIRKLQPNIKMWVRAQVASIMQEAVTCQYNNTQPGMSNYDAPSEIKNALSSSD